MGKGAWQATVHGVERVRHDLVTKPPLGFKSGSTFVAQTKTKIKTKTTHHKVYVFLQQHPFHILFFYRKSVFFEESESENHSCLEVGWYQSTL